MNFPGEREVTASRSGSTLPLTVRLSFRCACGAVRVRGSTPRTWVLS